MYINTSTGQYPLSELDLRLLHPNTSFPAPFTPPDGYAWVFPTPKPTYNNVIQDCVLGTPQITEKGHLEQTWIVISKFSEYTDTNGVTHTVEQQEIAALEEDSQIKLAEIKNNIIALTVKRLDDFAKTRNYDDIKSASDYAGCSVPKFSQEGTYCKNARAETWQALYNILEAVEANLRPVPQSFQEIEPELPILVWPA